MKKKILPLILLALLLMACGSKEQPPKGSTSSGDKLIIDLPNDASELQDLPATSILDEDQLNDEIIAQMFTINEIPDEVKQRMENISYVENEHIAWDDLRYLKVLHRGFDGLTHIGELVVHKEIADCISEIMYDLYLNDYAIEKMVLIDEYNGDDEASMQDNNTSAFNFRLVSDSDSLSKHSYGMAIDINPKYNPYLVVKNGVTKIYPADSWEYADRSKEFDHKLTANNYCVRLFIEHGFEWGGDWTHPKDYQHFEKIKEVSSN